MNPDLDSAAMGSISFRHGAHQPTGRAPSADLIPSKQNAVREKHEHGNYRSQDEHPQNPGRATAIMPAFGSRLSPRAVE